MRLESLDVEHDRPQPAVPPIDQRGQCREVRVGSLHLDGSADNQIYEHALLGGDLVLTAPCSHELGAEGIGGFAPLRRRLGAAGEPRGTVRADTSAP